MVMVVAWDVVVVVAMGLSSSRDNRMAGAGAAAASWVRQGSLSTSITGNDYHLWCGGGAPKLLQCHSWMPLDQHTRILTTTEGA
jgi:hypothetical protein